MCDPPQQRYKTTAKPQWKPLAVFFLFMQFSGYARTAKYNMGSYASATPDYTADKAIFGSVAASWANIEQAWSNGTYDASKVGSYDWASNGKQTGITHEHTLSASGGSEKFQGYASFGYLNQKGTQPGQAYERYTLKTSFDINPIDFFKMGTSINEIGRAHV